VPQRAPTRSVDDGRNSTTITVRLPRWLS